MAKARLSIMFLARSLEVGGAERQLLLLAKELHRRGHKVKIALFYRRGNLIDEAEQAGIELIDLHKSGRWDVFRFLFRTIATVRRSHADDGDLRGASDREIARERCGARRGHPAAH